ncbi:MAG: EAL domain-containing protein [Sulfuritalea sp.]|nr:EAL domain-containing protein [Sulfuritalea sp.]
MLLALGGSLLASLLSSRAYLEQQLSLKNADNASVFSLALSQQKPDLVTVELAVSALFDSGHYEAIRIRDPEGKVIVNRTSPTGELGAPEWFVRKLPLSIEPGEAQITHGWTQFGSVELISHSRFAYEALWRGTKQMIATLALAGFIGGYLGSLILRRLRRPLSDVIEQAEAITNRRFVTIPEPNVPELRRLAMAMNTTVARLKAMFDEEAARLESMRREANCDGLTGLANRDFFIAELRSALEGENSTGGILLLIRVADLAGINKRLGREATDDLLQRVAEQLRRYGTQKVGADATADFEGLAARMNGADFALLLPSHNKGRETADALLDALVKTMEPFVESGPSAYFGIGRFRQGTGLRAVLSQVDAALIRAESEGINAVQDAAIETDTDVPKSAEQWAKMIRYSLAQQWVRLVSFPVTDLRGRLLHNECPLRLKLDVDGDWLPAGQFLPVADRLGLTSQLDLAALTAGLEDLTQKPELKGLAINLSASSLAAPGFQVDLDKLLNRYRKVAGRLWIEVAETGVLKHVTAFRSLCKVLARYRCQVGVEHFGRQFSQIGQLHDLGLNYIKVDASFIRRLDTNPGNQAFLKGVSSIAHNIGLLVIAEGVVSDAEMNALNFVGFDGATGPGVKIANTHRDS